MNLILLSDGDFVSDRCAVLAGRRYEHVLGVHRAQVGDELRVGRLDGKMGRAAVTRIGAGSLEMRIVALDGDPPKPLPATLILALPRPKSLRRVLQCAAAMGVKRIVLVNTWRVEKSFWESPVLEPRAIREQLILGLEQARDTVVPEVSLRRRFKPFVEDELPQLAAATRRLAAHPVGDGVCPSGLRDPVTLAVGPEGGFIPYEIDELRVLGFEIVSLGPRALRVEHAVPALLGRIF